MPVTEYAPAANDQSAAPGITMEYLPIEDSTFGGQVQTIIAHPKPGSVSDPTPVLFEPGFMGTGKGYIAEIARQYGRRAITLRYFDRPADDEVLAIQSTVTPNDPDASGPEQKELSIISLAEAQSGLRQPGGHDTLVPRYRTRLGATTLAAMHVVDEKLRAEQGTSGQFDGIFQCADAIDGQLAILGDLTEEPKLFRNVVLVNPAGIIKQDRKPLQGIRDGLVFLWRAVARRVPGSKNFRRYEATVTGDTDNASRKIRYDLIGATSTLTTYMADVLTKIRGAAHAPSISLTVDLSDKLMDWKAFFDTLRPDDFDFMLITDRAHGIDYSRKTMAGIMSLFDRMNALRASRPKDESGQPAPLPPLEQRIVFSDEVSDRLRQKVLERARQMEARDPAATRRHGSFAHSSGRAPTVPTQ